MIEDDREQRLRGEEILAALGYEPVGFARAEDAIASRLMASRRFDAIVIGGLPPLNSALACAASLCKAALDRPILVATASIDEIDANTLRLRASSKSSPDPWLRPRSPPRSRAAWRRAHGRLARERIGDAAFRVQPVAAVARRWSCPIFFVLERAVRCVTFVARFRSCDMTTSCFCSTQPRRLGREERLWTSQPRPHAQPRRGAVRLESFRAERFAEFVRFLPPACFVPIPAVRAPWDSKG
jgi:hypothetical protein